MLVINLFMSNWRRKRVFLKTIILVASSQLIYLLRWYEAKSRNNIFTFTRERTTTNTPNKMMSCTFIFACLLIFTHSQWNHITNTQGYNLFHHNSMGRALGYRKFIFGLFNNKWIHIYLRSWKKTNCTEFSCFLDPIKRNFIIFRSLSFMLGVFSKKKWSCWVRGSLYVQINLRHNICHFTLNFVPFSRCYY